nr:hypothetical protein [Tanacetum cinerariifolium]
MPMTLVNPLLHTTKRVQRLHPNRNVKRRVTNNRASTSAANMRYNSQRSHHLPPVSTQYVHPNRNVKRRLMMNNLNIIGGSMCGEPHSMSIDNPQSNSTNTGDIGQNLAIEPKNLHVLSMKSAIPATHQSSSSSATNSKESLNTGCQQKILTTSMPPEVLK